MNSLTRTFADIENGVSKPLSKRPVSSVLFTSVLMLTALFSFASWPQFADASFADSVYQKTNARWPYQFEKLNPYLYANRSYLILNLIEPSRPMDLRSAENFRRSFLAPGVTSISGKPTLGHSLLGWQCAGKNGEVVRGASAITGELSEQSAKMIKAGWGLTTIASTYTDGYLQTPDIMEQVLENRSKKERIYSVVFEIEAKDCDNILKFVKSFIYHPSRPMRRFGLAVKPEKLQGAGCGSWAVALLDKAEVFPMTATAVMSRKLSAPTSYFGYGLQKPDEVLPYQPRHAPEGTQNSVSMFRLIDGPWIDNGPQESLTIVDPELVLLAIRKLHQHYLETLHQWEKNGQVQRGTHRTVANAYNARYPRQRVIKSYIPFDAPEAPSRSSEPFRVVELPIDERLDGHAQYVGIEMKNWWDDKIAQGYQSFFVFDDRMSYLVIRRP